MFDTGFLARDFIPPNLRIFTSIFQIEYRVNNEEGKKRRTNNKEIANWYWLNEENMTFSGLLS